MSALVVLWLPSAAANNPQPININRASAQQIQLQLPGIGQVKAKAIIDYRNRQGPFQTPEQLLEIKGIGPHTLDRIRALIKFSDGTAQFYSQPGQQNANARDIAIRQEIRRIVTRAQRQATN